MAIDVGPEQKHNLHLLENSLREAARSGKTSLHAKFGALKQWLSCAFDIAVLDPICPAQSPVHSTGQTWRPRTKLPPLSTSTTRCLSVRHCFQKLLAHASRCPSPRSTALRNGTQASIDPSLDRLMHNSWAHKNILRGEVQAPTHQGFI